MPKNNSLFADILIGLFAIPVLFLSWLFVGSDFGPAKAFVFVLSMLLFGSAFFFH